MKLEQSWNKFSQVDEGMACIFTAGALTALGLLLLDGTEYYNAALLMSPLEVRAGKQNSIVKSKPEMLGLNRSG